MWVIAHISWVEDASIGDAGGHAYPGRTTFIIRYRWVPL
jgi:hypothetical protein